VLQNRCLAWAWIAERDRAKKKEGPVANLLAAITSSSPETKKEEGHTALID